MIEDRKETKCMCPLCDHKGVVSSDIFIFKHIHERLDSYIEETVRLKLKFEKLEEQMSRQFDNNRTLVEVIDDIKKQCKFLMENKENKSGLSFE